MSVLFLAAARDTTGLVNLTSTTVFDTSAGPYSLPVSTYTGIDLNTHVGAYIDEALLAPAGLGSGSGAYRRLFQVGGDEIVNGYNRAVAKSGSEFEQSTPGGFDPAVRIGDLLPNQGYYQFSLDINEPSSGVERFLSIDELQLWVGGPNDPATLPNTVAGLPTLGTKVWDLQAGAGAGTWRDVMLDYSINTGSGTDDMYLFIPTSRLASFSSDSYIYLYVKHGEMGTAGNHNGITFNGFAQDQGGFEEWAVFTTTSTAPPAPYVAPIPEPSRAILLCLAAGVMIMRREVGWRSLD